MSKSSDYWGNRLDAIAQNRFDSTADEVVEKLKTLYNNASKNIQREVDSMFLKLAEKGKLSRSELYNFNRYVELQEEINAELIKLGDKEYKIFSSVFDEEFKNVFNMTREEMGLRKEFCLYNPLQANTIIHAEWMGSNYSSRIWSNTSKLSRVLKDNIEKTLLLGSSRSHMYKSVMDELRDTVDGNMQKAFNNADRLIRTELMHVINASQIECYKQAGYTKLEWLAYFDERTCDECGSLNGTVVDINSKDVAPAHPRCRCTMIPVLESLKEVDDHKNSDIINNKQDKGTKSNRNTTYVTKKDAIDRLNTHYGIEFKDSRKYPMDKDLLIDCVEWLDGFSDMYYGFMENNPCKLPLIENIPDSKIGGCIGKYTYYVKSRQPVSISLNGKYHSNVEAFNEYIELCKASQWYPANATTHKTFVHEYGHHVSNSMCVISKDSNWQHNFISDCINDFKKVCPEYAYNTHIGMKEYVSEYGASSESELFAEAFAEYYGGKNPRQFSKIFGEKLDKILKGVK